MNGYSELPQPIDWPRWLRLMERKRKLVNRVGTERTGVASMNIPSAFGSRRSRTVPAMFHYLGTAASFRIEGLDVSESTVLAATRRRPDRAGRERVGREGAGREMAGREGAGREGAGREGAGHDRGKFRSRLSQRIRSHIAILHQIERSLGSGELLKTPAVVRWYTLVSSGLSITSLDDARMGRLDQLVRRINSPHLRLQPAVQEIARLHAESLADPIVPGFNGILARLLLRYHLGRCGLPPVVFDADVDGMGASSAGLADEKRLLPRLLELIDQSYDLLLSGTAAATRRDVPPAF